MPIGILPATGGGGGASSIDVVQANAYKNGQAVYFDGATGLWMLANASNGAMLGLGFLSQVAPVGFRVNFSGPLGPLSAPFTGPYVPGAYYFVSPTIAGDLTLIEPVTPGEYSNPLWFALGTDTGIVLPFRPSIVSSTTVTPLILPFGGVMGDSTGAWTTAGALEIDWSDYTGTYTTWEFVGITTVSGSPFSASVQLFDQSNVATIASFASASTTPVSTTIAIGAIPPAGVVTYISQVKISAPPPTTPAPSDRAVLLSSFIKLS